MPAPKYPSQIESITFPVFGCDWYSDVTTKTDIQAICGGGGSARTGVNNQIVVYVYQDNNNNNTKETHIVSTEDQVCVALCIYQNPVSNTLWLVGCVGHSVVRYRLMMNDDETPSKAGMISLDESQKDMYGITNAVCASPLADYLAVGCDNGPIVVYPMTDDDFVAPRPSAPIVVLTGHSKAVCAMQFCLRDPSKLISSAKDGTARVWRIHDSNRKHAQDNGDNNNNNNTCIATLTCDVTDPNPPSKRTPSSNSTASKRSTQVLVRGCAWGDLEGKIIYTVASGRRGKAFLQKWTVQNDNNYACETRLECSPCPISAMSLSTDGSLLALGGVDGTIHLWSVSETTLKLLKQFKEVHELPVTGIAARPYMDLNLSTDDEHGVRMHALSASADSQLAKLTLQKRGPKKSGSTGGGGGGTILSSLYMIIWVAIVAWFLHYIMLQAKQECQSTNGISEYTHCVFRRVIIAESSRPGILVPPH
jgi:hypothetical protein